MCLPYPWTVYFTCSHLHPVTHVDLQFVLVVFSHGSGNTAKAMNIQHSRYKYMDDLLKLDRYGTPVGKPWWPTGLSPIVHENCIPMLNAHLNKRFAENIHAGLIHGFLTHGPTC